MDDFRDKYIVLIVDVVDEVFIEDLCVQVVGKKGEIVLKMCEFGKMMFEECQVMGFKLNVFKDEINLVFLVKKVFLVDVVFEECLCSEWLDVILSGCGCCQGLIYLIF